MGNFLLSLLTLVSVLLSLTSAAASPPRPKWMDHPGIVMAGNWEEPSFRARRMGQMDYRLPPDKQAEYQREHTPELIARLKDLGVNFIMLHCYKGAGFHTEREGMEDSRRFAELAHRLGMRIGAYIGGTLLYERLFEEIPEARQWQAFGPQGEMLYYNPGQKFRYAAIKHHPGFIEYLKRPVRFAIEEMHAELIHFDNFGSGTNTYDPYTRKRFREFLQEQGKPSVDPPADIRNTADPLVRAWTDFKCRLLAEHYAAMGQYIRQLNPQCAIEANPGGVGGGSAAPRGVDHARLLPLGHAFWDEGFGAAWDPAKKSLRSRIRSLKAGQTFNNSTFLYCESGLDLAESMAFNVNCLGSVCWFEWGKIETAHLTGKPLPPELKTYIRFFLDHQDLYRDARPVSEVAVLRSFLDQAYGPRHYLGVEQGVIQGQIPWRMIFDEHLAALDPHQTLVVPEDDWLLPEQREKLSQFTARGGKVVRASALKKPADFAAIAARGRFRIEAPASVAFEVRAQAEPRRLVLHLVNYDPQASLGSIPIAIRGGERPPVSARLLSPDPVQDIALPMAWRDGAWHLSVPSLQTYTVVVVQGLD